MQFTNGSPAPRRLTARFGNPTVRSDQRVVDAIAAGDPPALVRAPWPRAAGAEGTIRVLSARQFAFFFDRERCLADRGTRRFSVLVMGRREGDRDKRRGRAALAELARQVGKRLRATDLVGRLDADRVQVLLTDTEPVGAQAVAAWIALIETELGLDLERRIQVYPAVSEPGTAGHQDDRARGTPPNAPDTVDPSEPVVAADPWPVQDLWPQLVVPTPRGKRCLDVVLAALVLMILSPAFVLIALAIRLDSSGPVIFRQLRAGRGGRPFVFYKFRSMVADAEQRRSALAAANEQDGPIFKIWQDPRITRVGRLLRRWSLDELPQLWNVLKGDLSLVGPRSPTLPEVSLYERWQRRRLGVTGGITCTWQVSGRSEIPFRDWMRLDLRYITRCSLWGDLLLLARTVPAVILGRGAC